MLHGANGDASNGIGPYSRSAEDRGLILVAPASRGGTWDLMLGGYGPDIEFIDRALKKVFGRYAVDPAHLVIQGFSDGASYALSVGMANPELFSHVAAFSPGYFDDPGQQSGKPKIWISHGTEDDILPIDSTSREIVPELREMGYKVRYEEFVGPHRPWPEMSERSIDWWLNDG
jgi:phospholipase/carboxylesterase